MTPEITSHIVWGVLWVAFGLVGMWAAVALSVLIASARLVGGLDRGFDHFTKRSARTLAIPIVGWVIGASWFVFSVIKAVIHVVSIFM